jgi:hypothetical protein
MDCKAGAWWDVAAAPRPVVFHPVDAARLGPMENDEHQVQTIVGCFQTRHPSLDRVHVELNALPTPEPR